MSLAAGTYVRQTEESTAPAKRKSLRVLILTKQSTEYGHEINFKSGLSNTAQMLADELAENLKIETKFISCVDGNSVDREVYNYKPTHVILEAIWVTPAKLAEVQKLHPTVIFVVRVHSKITFLAYEGNAIEWLQEFQKTPNTFIGFNSGEAFNDFKNILLENVICWLPNLYKKVDYEKISFFTNIINFFHKPKNNNKTSLDVGCFGAVRPMKDILLQAVAAIQYCDKHGLQLRFHINSDRVEQKGDSTLRNLRALFANKRHELIEHGWLSHAEFNEIVRTIDLGMQVSLNESFNVVTADYVYNLRPIVVSDQIYWVSDECKASHNIDSIVACMHRVLDNANLLKENLHLLHKYNEESLKEWLRFLLETEL